MTQPELIFRVEFVLSLRKNADFFFTGSHNQ